MIGTRFHRWTGRDDGPKESFLYLIDGGSSEADALRQLNGRVTSTMLRQWLREDRDFAKAVRVARRGDNAQPHIY